MLLRDTSTKRVSRLAYGRRAIRYLREGGWVGGCVRTDQISEGRKET
jgi:hypothetical protein